MKPSSFQTTIENQFDYICKRAMEDERKNYMLYLSRIAKRELPDKKREILLLFYFMDMSDSEIADLLKLNRSTVYRHRTSGLALIKKFMEEFEE
ncbi:TPA: RNA polymerase sigma factor [Staphylococcus aureus]|nr:sigma-70 family RNA polymerase sigma factor [Staphylococcus aureus]